jgi:hypothetical protein
VLEQGVMHWRARFEWLSPEGSCFMPKPVFVLRFVDLNVEKENQLIRMSG